MYIIDKIYKGKLITMVMLNNRLMLNIFLQLTLLNSLLIRTKYWQVVHMFFVFQGLIHKIILLNILEDGFAVNLLMG